MKGDSNGMSTLVFVWWIAHGAGLGHVTPRLGPVSEPATRLPTPDGRVESGGCLQFLNGLVYPGRLEVPSCQAISPINTDTG